MTVRKKLSPSARARVFLVHGGVCSLCARKIAPGEDYDLDHVLPLALGGADEASNLVPVHVDCHRGKGGKTASDIGRIRKADRNAKRHAGIKKKSRFLNSKDGPFITHVGGRTERRA